MPTQPSTTHLLLTRPGMQEHLLAECRQKDLVLQGSSTETLLCASPLPATALMFERQRLPHVHLLPTKTLKPFDEAGAVEIWQQLLPELQPWSLQLFASEENDARLDARLPGLERLLRKTAKIVHPAFLRYERKAEKLFRQGKGMMVQGFLRPEGLWLSAAPPQELSARKPGGRYRMKMDADAPSRSFLKMEEALSRMLVVPDEGDQVVDLGAAPGGWTWAFVTRGCQVTAVDNGPLKLPARAEAQVQHLKADGMRYRLKEEKETVDWLVGDMLIPPGKAFSLLRYWVGENRARRIVMNIKLPQREPLPALQPVQEWLQTQSQWELQIRQLYHDRREVTVFGSRNA